MWTMKNLILCILFLIIIPIASAQTLYHQQETNLSFSITSNNATGCNVTSINTPVGLALINQQGTQNSRTFNFTIDGSNYSELGVYCHQIECSDGSTTLSGEQCYTVNYFGKELSTSQSLLYIGLLAMLIFILFISFFGMGFLPNANQKDEFDRILSVSYLKYLRLPAWLFMYFLFIAIVFLSSNIAFAFLSEQMFGKILFSIYTILFALAPIVVIIIMISFFVKFFHDKEFQQYLNRGIFPGSDL